MRADTGRLRVVAHDLAEAEVLPEDVLDDGFADLAGDDDLPSPGAFIEAQRRRRGLSLQQLGVATKIPARSLELLEADRYDELPGPVFVKGFLRCAARALGVDQQSVMELLHERERAQMQARRTTRVEPRAVSDMPTAAAFVEVEAPKLPPRPGAKTAANAMPGPLSRLRASLPSAHAIWWVVIALVVGFLVLAAFNLAGTPGGLQS